MPKGHSILSAGQASNDNYFADNGFRLLSTGYRISIWKPLTHPIVIISAPVCRNFPTFVRLGCPCCDTADSKPDEFSTTIVGRMENLLESWDASFGVLPYMACI
jgi:hypothetical protein